jgi:toxin secretion/phage lysis holin
MKENEVLKLLFAGLGSFLASLFGGFDVLLQTLLIFMVLDYITGMIKAIKKKKLSSHIGYWGGIKKLGILCVIVISYRADVMLGKDFLRNGACIFYIANEGISILENIAIIGVKVPKKLKEVLIQLNKENN